MKDQATNGHMSEIKSAIGGIFYGMQRKRRRPMHQYIQNYSPLRLDRVVHEIWLTCARSVTSHARNHVRLHGSVIAQPEAVRDACSQNQFGSISSKMTRGAICYEQLQPWPAIVETGR